VNNTLQLGETVETLDPAIALQGEYGTFRVQTPNNESMLVTCQQGHSISHIAIENRNDRRPFRVTKVIAASQQQQQQQPQQA